MSTPNPADLVVVRQGTRNNLTGETTAALEHTVADCIWAPQPSTEQSPRSEVGQQVVTRRDVFPPDPDPDIRSTDRVRFPGETGAPWLVVGDVEQWVSPWDDGGPQGSKIVVERTTG